MGKFCDCRGDCGFVLCCVLGGQRKRSKGKCDWCTGKKGRAMRKRPAAANSVARLRRPASNSQRDSELSPDAVPPVPAAVVVAAAASAAAAAATATTPPSVLERFVKALEDLAARGQPQQQQAPQQQAAPGGLREEQQTWPGSRQLTCLHPYSDWPR